MTQITSEVLLVSHLFLKGRFTVPWHQRHYDWALEQVTELLVDLKEACDENRSSYFLGSIMLAKGGCVWEINDGQQRLITLSLLFAAFGRRFARNRNSDSDAGREMFALRVLFDHPGTAVGNFDDTTRDVPRVEPPRQDRSRFTQIIRGLDIGTNGKLTSSWNEVALFVSAMDANHTRRFFDFLRERVEVGVLYVPKTEDANAVFEALNGRGKRLDDIDLIRNHLYSYFTDSADLERRATVHDQLESILATTRNATRSQEYFRCFFQCKYGYLQKKRFYRETRAKIRSSGGRQDASSYVYSLIHELAKPASVELFRTISSTNPNTDLLESFRAASGTTRHKRNLPVFIREMHGYKVVQPLMFALLRRFVEARDQSRQTVARAVHRCLNNLSSFVMRVSFCEAKFEPSRLEPGFANCARRIAASTKVEELDIRTDLEECDELLIMDDKRFISRLLEVQMTDSRRAKRLLFGIIAKQESEGRAFNYDSCSVEHILPKSKIYWAGWSGFDSAGPDRRDWVDRIGNLTLLGDNATHARQRFNANFSAKKPFFEESPFAMTRDIAQHDDWTPTTVVERSRALAQAASQVWRFYGPAERC